MARKGSVDRGLFRRDGVWWVRWSCGYGHEHKEKIGTAKGMARAFYERRKLAVKVEGYCLTEHKAKVARERPVLFRDAAKRYLEWAEQDRPRSLEFRQCAMKHLLAAFAPMALSEITPTAIDAYITTRRDSGAAPGTINRERTTLSHLFTKSMKWGVVAANPVKATDPLEEPDGVPRPLTHDEEARLLSALPARYRPFVVLALHTGLRLGELKAQAWKDIDLTHGSLTVTRPKSKKLETLPLNRTAKALLASLERTGPMVFPGLPIGLSNRFSERAQKTGLQHVTFHSLRDTYISRLAPHVSATTLMTLARHRDLRTTRRYLKIEEHHLRTAVETLNETGTQTGTEKTAVSELLDSLGITG